jgi:transcriptional regulator with XRE-family HTH domain
MKATAEQVKLAREKAGDTQKQAAERCGVTTRSWERWETGIHGCPQAILESYCMKTHQKVPEIER